MQPKYVVGLFIVALLVGAFMPPSSPAVAAGEGMVPMRSITVSGMAQRKVVPDEAHVVVTLGAADMKLAAAKKLHDDKLKKLYTIADKHDVPEKHLTTQNSSVQPIYEWVNNDNGGRQIFKGYRVITTIDVKLEKPEKLGDVVEQIMSSGLEEANQQEYGQLLSTHYAISNPDEIRDEMLAEAITNAKAKADRMAAATGAKVVGVYQISENGMPQFQPQPVPMMAMAKMERAGAAADASIAPPAGEQEMQANVNVVFELKN